MKIGGPTEQGYFDVITPAIITVADMKRLMEIANDMNNKPQCQAAFITRSLCILKCLGEARKGCCRIALSWSI